MSEHSPAPWMWDGPPHNIHVVQANAPHMRVCFLTSNGPTEANARLISAAPDLLAALRAMVDRWEPDTEGLDRVMWENACAAIDKATGQGSGA